MTNEVGAAGRIRLVELEAELARLRGQYDLLMSAFEFDAARALGSRIEAAERARGELAKTLPPLSSASPPAPYRVARRRRR